MKFFRLVLIVFVLVNCLCLFSFADSTSGAGISSEPDIFQADSTPQGLTVVVNPSSDDSRISALEERVNALSDSDSLPSFSDSSMQLMSVNVSSERISASDANGFKAVLLGLLGDYETIITDYTYSSSQGYTSHSIDITPDYSWIGSCAVFALVVFCAFRLVGGILCNR